jgi:lipopolysaccharide transport system ATP-binding protein
VRAPAIRVSGLSKRFRIGERVRYKSLRESIQNAVKAPFRRGRRAEETIWALREVSFEVAPGEVVGVIGRNGAGKSTLLKVLSRITEPTEGRVELRGRVGSLLEVGTGFHLELTGRENIFLNGAILGMKRVEIERKFDEIVAFAEIERFLDTPVKHYSTGMYLRLAFAVAAHLEPEILLVDEVLAVGDAAFQKRCLGKMGEVARGGRTVLLVSHNLNAVEGLCRSVLLLEGGRLAAAGGEVRAIVNRYLGGDEGSVPRSEWCSVEADAEDRPFQPLRFAVVDARGRPAAMPLRNDEPIWIEIEGRVTVSDPALCVGYAVWTHTEELLYWSLSTDGAEARWPRVAPGRNVWRSPLPTRLLNEGDYRLELLANLHYRQWLVQPGHGAPSLDITIRGGLSESPYWTARRPGLLAPVCEWQCEPR